MARADVIHYEDVMERLTDDRVEYERRVSLEMMEEWLKKIVERKRRRECFREAYLKLDETYPLTLDDDDGWRRRLYLQSFHYGEDPLSQMEVKERDLVTKSYHEAYQRLEKESPLRLDPSQCKELFIQDLALPYKHVERTWTLAVEEGKKSQEREEKETLKESLRKAYRKMEEERPLRFQPSLVSELARRRNVFDERLKVSVGDGEGKNMRMWERQQLYRKVIDGEEAKYWRELDAALEVDVREAYLKLYADRPVLEEPHKNRARAERKSAYTLTLEEVQTMSHWDKEVARRKTNILSSVVENDIFQYRRAERGKQEEDEEEEEEREEARPSRVYDMDEEVRQFALRDARWKEETKQRSGEVARRKREEARGVREEARRVKREAKEEARRVKREAKEEAKRVKREAKEEVKRVKREAKEEVKRKRAEAKEEARRKRAEAKEEVKRKRAEAKSVREEAKEEVSEEAKEEVKKEKARVRRKVLYEAGRSEREAAKKVKEEASKVRRKMKNATRNAAAREERAVAKNRKGIGSC